MSEYRRHHQRATVADAAAVLARGLSVLSAGLDDGTLGPEDFVARGTEAVYASIEAVMTKAWACAGFVHELRPTSAAPLVGYATVRAERVVASLEGMTDEAPDVRSRRTAALGSVLWAAYEHGFGLRMRAEASARARTFDTGPRITITWVAQMDDTCCLQCAARDGTEYTFATLPGYPGDGDFGSDLCEGGPNCRCELDYSDADGGGSGDGEASVTGAELAARSAPAAGAGAGHSHDLSRVSVLGMLEQRFYDTALTMATAVARSGWCAEDGLEARVERALAGFDTVNRASARRWGTWLATSVGLVAHVGLGGNEWELNVAGSSATAVDQVVDRFERLLPEFSPDVADDDGVFIRYWAMGPLGPVSYYRRIEAAPFSAVAANYPGALGGELGSLMRMRTGPDDGRLALWHGPPGTGKTRGILSLAHAWRSWCDVDYIVDADAFFKEAAYMIGALVDGADYEDHWRLVVIEDAGEYLSTRSSERIGQGRTRLLNLSDGLVGQGLRVMLLMTTNEPDSDFDPAVTRPGRRFSQLEFGPFSPEEGAAWLAGRGITDAEVADPVTLAELYAMLKPMRASAAIERLVKAGVVD